MSNTASIITLLDFYCSVDFSHKAIKKAYRKKKQFPQFHYQKELDLKVKLNLYTLILIILLFSGCKKKEEPIIFLGQLLLTNKFRRPLVNREIEVYQAGSSAAIGINSGSTSSTATTNTDANGNFQLTFMPGTSSFILFSSPNYSALRLGNSPSDTTFPRFSRKNFPDSAYDVSKPIFVGKIVDTVIIKVGLSSNLTQADTVGLQAYTISGSINREYTRRSGTMGAIIILDTVYNLLLTDFDCFEKKFNNTVYAGRKWTTIWGYKTISVEGFIAPSQFSAIDEAKKEIIFYFKK